MQRASSELSKNTHKHIIINRLWAPLSIASVITILSGSAGIQTGPLHFIGIDKVGHLVVFGLLGISIARLFRKHDECWKGVLFLSVGFATGFGMLDELHQLRNPMRTFEWADLAADFLGSLIASLLYLRWRGLRNLLEFEIRGFLRLRLTGKK